eukprot:3186772-Prymnesium_polylepis.1
MVGHVGGSHGGSRGAGHTVGHVGVTHGGVTWLTVRVDAGESPRERRVHPERDRQPRLRELPPNVLPARGAVRLPHGGGVGVP